MITFLTIRTIVARRFSRERIGPTLRACFVGWCVCFSICLMAITGCQEPPVINTQVDRDAEHKQPAQAVEQFTLQSGDTVKISFPSAPNLDTTQQIRSDGRVTLPMVGEVVASGKTPIAFEKELVSQYSSQLVSKEVSVTVVSAPFAVFVSGAVQRPGKIVTDHPISALEAIMEAGGFDNSKANMTAVVVVRQVGAGTKNYTLDLKQVLEGKQVEIFYLRRSDIVHVPEKFTWF
jgi:polysaccharide export outer membrane protein